MHLLAAEPGVIADGSAAVDLGHSPADIVVLLSADTEIALLAAAQTRRRTADPGAPIVRLAPVLRLGHNFSVDRYMEVVGRARLVIARVLGGSAYWPYGWSRPAASPTFRWRCSPATTNPIANWNCCPR
jgi:cobaltochelatase CobN